jgi:4-hydroxybenzoate polyprenyltransferase
MGLRYVPTLKIFIVALCWSTLATFELFNTVSVHFVLIASKALLWILVLIVPLEIHDLNSDAPRLKTLPQVLGVRGVKLLSYFLILMAMVLALMTATKNILAWIEIGVLVVLGTLIFKVKRDRPKHLTSLYVEAIPVLWWGLSFLALIYC